MRKRRSFYLGDSDHADGCNFYHIVVRASGGDALFDADMRDAFREILTRQLQFSGLRCLAWCIMDNHFHLLLEVPHKERALEGWSEDDLLARVAVLQSEYSTKILLGQMQAHQENGEAKQVAQIASRVRARLFDLSAFMKELKMKMTGAYRAAHDRRGTLWEGRFKSLLVERGEALRVMAAYIDLNSVRAGLVDDPKDYRWCSYAAAMRGVKGTRSGLALAVTGKAGSPWRAVSAEYYKLLFGTGSGDSRSGFSARQIKRMLDEGGKLPMAAALRCRVRYFTDGVVLGSEEFVDAFFEHNRSEFGVLREEGARLMRGADWGGLRTLRALRVEAMTLPKRRGFRR